MNKYPSGTVRELLAADAVTTPTREALEKRLSENQDAAPKFFAAEVYEILQAVCGRLIPQNEIDCAHFIDKKFSEKTSDGWRYDKLPDDAETFQKGLRGVDDSAREKLGKSFARLNDAQQDEILTAIQNGEAIGKIWKTLDAKLFFEEILAQTVEVFYAHPLAQEAIGYVGMADAPGWTGIKLNELEPREPRVLKQEIETTDVHG